MGRRDTTARRISSAGGLPGFSEALDTKVWAQHFLKKNPGTLMPGVDCMTWRLLSEQTVHRSHLASRQIRTRDGSGIATSIVHPYLSYPRRSGCNRRILYPATEQNARTRCAISSADRQASG